MGTFKNLFSIQSLKIPFIEFIIVPVMCIRYTFSLRLDSFMSHTQASICYFDFCFGFTFVIHLVSLSFLIQMSLPNNNHNPNSKTTIAVVELRQNNCWEHPPSTHHTNSKLHDTVGIEQNSEKSH